MARVGHRTSHFILAIFFLGINMDPTKKTRVYMNILEIKIHQPVKSGLFDFLFDIWPVFFIK